jgi:hypothetical protein
LTRNKTRFGEVVNVSIGCNTARGASATVRSVQMHFRERRALRCCGNVFAKRPRDATHRSRVNRMCALRGVRFLAFRPVAFTRASAHPNTDTRALSDANTIPKSNAIAGSTSDSNTHAFPVIDLSGDRRSARCCHTRRDQQRRS